ncbi:MAG TPA: acyl-CoA dehydrogenase family protein, partial [Beijerinckiaceae bacterium]|nr:acyl-CoA dehydrogenase family protein [Beijerinckiaceae bacterium]
LTLGGDHETNQVFFDDVRVPVENRVGAEGQGWATGKYLLEFERGGAMTSGRLRAILADIEKLASTYRDGEKAYAATETFALRRSQAEIDIDALEMTELRIMSSLQSGQNPGSVSSSLAKLRNSEIKQSLTALAVDVLGQDGLYWEGHRPLYEMNAEPGIPEDALTALPEYLNSRAYTIFGGTSEVQRDIIAKVVIGM